MSLLIVGRRAWMIFGEKKTIGQSGSAYHCRGHFSGVLQQGARTEAKYNEYAAIKSRSKPNRIKTIELINARGRPEGYPGPETAAADSAD